MSGLWSFRQGGSTLSDMQTMKDALPLAFTDLSLRSVMLDDDLARCTADHNDYNDDDEGGESDAHNNNTFSTREWFNNAVAAATGASSADDYSTTAESAISATLLDIHGIGGGLHNALDSTSSSSSQQRIRDIVLQTDDLSDIRSLLVSATSTIDVMLGLSEKKKKKDESIAASTTTATTTTTTPSIAAAGSSSTIHNSFRSIRGGSTTSKGAPSTHRSASLSSRTNRNNKETDLESNRTPIEERTSSHTSGEQSRQVPPPPLAETSQKRTDEEEQQPARSVVEEAQSFVRAAHLHVANTDDELRQRSCLEAITNIRRDLSVKQSLQRVTPCLVSSSSSARNVCTSYSASTAAAPERAVAAPSSCSNSTHSSFSRQQNVTRTTVAHRSSSEVPSTMTTSASTTASRRADPWQRLYSSVAKRQEDIDAIEAKGGIVFDHRRLRNARIERFAAASQAKAQQEAADTERKKQLAVEHNRKRLLRRYGWTAWRSLIEDRLSKERAADTIAQRHSVACSFRIWVEATRVAQRVHQVASYARTLAMIRFLFYCWKRRCFLYWRSVVVLHKAQQRDADRYRKKHVLTRWRGSLMQSVKSKERSLDAKGDHAHHVYVRRQRHRLFNKWRGRVEALALERHRVAFRHTVDQYVHQGTPVPLWTEAIVTTTAEPSRSPTIFDDIPAFLR